MTARLLLVVVCAWELSALGAADGGGGHKKVVIHVPVFVKHHHHKHTVVKHVHHQSGGGGDDHYELLGYTYGEPKAAPHYGGGHGWGAGEESYGHDSPVSFEGGDHGGHGGHGGYSLSGDGHGY